ncbi:MAG: EscU/YscU/HrcU family type III secretion system export apparatus switch protein, partial [Burkholderiales bacterium]
SKRSEMLALVTEAIDPALAHMAQLISRTFLIMTGAFAFIVVIDVPFQLWDFARQMRMTKEEVRQESKETEGNPQTKGRVRSMQREQARRRMMAQVPKADVIVTNPTHYAVALQYQDQSMRAPRVIAKGALLVAERIAEIGQTSGVPTLRAPELARALFAHAEIGQDIPAPLYNAVAEVLAWVYQLHAARASGAQTPEPPRQLAVPANLDPGPTEA